MDKPKILIANLRHIGDALLITPLLQNLKHSYPNAQIDVLVNKECAELFYKNHHVNAVLEYDRTSYKKQSFIKRLFGELKFSFCVRGYDIYIATTEGERSAFLAFLSGAKTRVGIRPPKGVFAKLIKPYTHEYAHTELLRHTVERNLDALRAINLQIVSKKVGLYFDKKDANYIDSLIGGSEFIHIHAPSRWAFKCLPIDTIVNVIDSLDLKVILTGAPNDAEYNTQIVLGCKKNIPLDLSGKLSLLQMAALSSRAKLFFGVDSAPMHIAASQNIPCVAVFGPSGAFNWGPWDNDILECGYVNKNGVQSMGKHKVLQVNWDCAPCGKDGCDGSKKSKCLEVIDANDIVKLIVNSL